MAELLRVICQDAAMSAKMLAVANSSAYHRDAPVGRLDQALQSIGTEMIKTIVINESVSQIFDKMSRARGVDLRGFWAHALKAGVIARIVAQKINYSNPEEAYLAGLLHDVGRLVLVVVLPREYGYNFQAADNDDLCAVEERTLQTTHAEVGAWLIEDWKLDSFVADSVLYHHETPARLQKTHPLIRITHVAHTLARHGVPEQEIEQSGALCGLKLVELLAVQSQAHEQLQKTARQLNIDLDADRPPTDFSGTGAGHSATEPTRQKMLEQVSGMMLTAILERSFARQNGETELTDTVARSARILFNFESVIILMMNPAGDALIGSRSGELRQRLADITLPIHVQGSTISDAAREQRIVFTAPVNQGMDIFEEQLLRLFGTAHLACLPLCVEDTCLGVLIGGFNAWQTDELDRRVTFMKTFSSLAATALRKQVLHKADSAQQAENLARGYREASRKVAHEVNNPLSIIKNYLIILDRKLTSKDEVAGEVAILSEEIERVGKIINEFAEVDLTEHSGRIEISHAIESVLRLFRQASPLLQIENRMPDEHYEVNGSTDMLKQIFVNLIKNAAEAMNDEGLIDIGSSGLINRDGTLYVSIWLRDNGPGIPTEVMAKLFSPLQSSKGNGRRGLGLNIVHDLVKKMQGLITCKSTRQGTTFDIMLPVAQTTLQQPVIYS